MPKQRDVAALREAIRTTAFTPGSRDVDGLVTLLGDDDDAVVRDAERALVAAASAVGLPFVPRLLGRLREAPAETRAPGFRVLGRLAPEDVASAEWLIEGLSDPDGRVQKSAVQALGRLQKSAAADAIGRALLEAWDATPELPVARALAEALGKLGITAAHGRLESVRDGDAELARVARKAETMLVRDGSRGEESRVDEVAVSDFDVEVVFTCRAGLEAVVCEEVREKLPNAHAVKAGPDGSGRVTARWQGALRELLDVRTALGFAFALPAEPIADERDVERAAVRVLASDAARRMLETWTRGSLRYRLDWEGQGHRRGATWSVVHALAGAPSTARWVNDPTESTWQLSLRASGGALRVLLVPKGLLDPRFSYRLRDVPAASHPTIAAALVRLSRTTDDDVVWDPFVGSGSELVERARAGKYARLIGSDLDANALAAAQTNFGAAGVAGASLEQAAATEYAPPGVTRIITNPPMGRRVARDGSLAELLDRFTDHAAKVLVSGGRLTWLSPLAGRTSARAEANGLRVVLRREVDLGGFHAELQAWEKS